MNTFCWGSHSTYKQISPFFLHREPDKSEQMWSWIRIASEEVLPHITMVMHCIVLIASFIVPNWGISFPGKRNQQRKQKSNLKGTVPMEVFVTKGHTKVSKWYHWKKKKLEIDLTQDGLSQFQDLGLNCLPLLQCSITTFATQSSNKAWIGV